MTDSQAPENDGSEQFRLAVAVISGHGLKSQLRVLTNSCRLKRRDEPLVILSVRYAHAEMLNDHLQIELFIYWGMHF